MNENTISYSDHDPRESYDYKLGQKEAWNEFKALLDSHMMKSGMRRDIDALRGVREDIEAKIEELAQT